MGIACRAKVLEGDMLMLMNYSLTDEEVKDGYVLKEELPPIEKNGASYVYIRPSSKSLIKQLSDSREKEAADKKAADEAEKAKAAKETQLQNTAEAKAAKEAKEIADTKSKEAEQSATAAKEAQAKVTDEIGRAHV